MIKWLNPPKASRAWLRSISLACAAGGLANADVTIKLEGNDWSHTSINSLISGADPTIKIDHTA